MKLINLTPHSITIVTTSGSVTIPPHGAVARVETTRELVGMLPASPGPQCPTPHGASGGCPTTPEGCTSCSFGVPPVPVYQERYEGVTNLPAPMAGVLYIVSRMVAAAHPDRADLYVPGELVRDNDGRIIGCRGFVTMAEPEPTSLDGTIQERKDACGMY